jgi:hypothetical protein
MDVFRPTFHMIKSTYLYECSSLKTRERLAGALSTSEPNHSALCVCVCVCAVLCGQLLFIGCCRAQSAHFCT